MRFYRSGEHMRCPTMGCAAWLHSVPAQTTASVRAIACREDAVPGSLALRCAKCSALVEVRALADARARAA